MSSHIQKHPEDGRSAAPGSDAQCGRETVGPPHPPGAVDASLNIPVVEEELHVGKRIVEGGGVRVTRRTQIEQQLIEQALKREAVEVERVPVNRVVTAAPATRQEGDALIIPIVEEVLVVQKQLVVREELHVRKRVREEVKSQSVGVRRETVEVERITGPENPGEAGTRVAKPQ